VPNGDSILGDHENHAGKYSFTGLDGSYDDQILRYQYSFGDFTGAASIELDDDEAVVQNSNLAPSANGDVNWSVGGIWASNIQGVDYRFAAGYQDNGDHEVWGLSGTALMGNGLSVSAGYADLDKTKDAAKNNVVVDGWYGIGVSYETGPWLAAANYGRYDAVSGSDPRGWGVVVNYDLGGGASLQAGYGDSDGSGPGGKYVSSTGNGEKTWSAGLAMSF